MSKEMIRDHYSSIFTDTGLNDETYKRSMQVLDDLSSITEKTKCWIENYAPSINVQSISVNGDKYDVVLEEIKEYNEIFTYLDTVQGKIFSIQEGFCDISQRILKKDESLLKEHFKLSNRMKESIDSTYDLLTMVRDRAAKNHWFVTYITETGTVVVSMKPRIYKPKNHLEFIEYNFQEEVELPHKIPQDCKEAVEILEIFNSAKIKWYKNDMIFTSCLKDDAILQEINKNNDLGKEYLASSNIPR